MRVYYNTEPSQQQRRFIMTTGGGFRESVVLSSFIEVRMDFKHGERASEQVVIPSACPVYIQVSDRQCRELNGLELGTLGGWCRALSGQGGQLELLSSSTEVHYPEDTAQLEDTVWFYRFRTHQFCKQNMHVQVSEAVE